ncbi:Cytochrome P450 61 [Fulvia fulva]|uniref:Cytochrome P450 61 n=1 Tax=Passalora fulva TaxID=5499 RepID=A0A9Q8LBZ3_PASFU|nr:Cytochrome P450 61 [Fulvia fulva]KAK4632000.1 Cytochrome P450 61 [Fulvia fulva]KAK4633362.1 Cytochrome P450 61 [Fulvia fulva]UJO13958.1 Cytochrome P450 61 [Fulvia fulva]WPV10942.1 Cytochrome P450 61 [Fulvia fulva]WPV25867.1 Cytochrome P450 61 [Fulvia fulva]
MASIMEAGNATSTSLPGAIHATIESVQTGFLSKAFENGSPVSWFSVFLTLFAAAVVYDQLSYRSSKGPLVGDFWKIPFVGPFLESVNPRFEAYHRKWLSGPLSCVSVFHKFVVIAATRDMARKVFNSPMYVKPCVVDVAHKLLRPDNWVFLDGKEHVEYRKGLNGLFTRNALETYLPGQQEVYAEYFEDWLRESEAAGSSPKPWVYNIRELITAVSCRTFVGHYMSREQVKKIAEDYYYITAALELVNFPIIVPFTKTWYGKKAADQVLDVFSNCAAKSRVRMRQKGVEPECIMDRWIVQMIESDKYRERIAKGEKVPDEEKPAMLLRNFSDIEISMTVFTFLFASQDATSSAASWLLQIVADNPEIMRKVREEGDKFRPDHNQDVALDVLEKMQYTRSVVKETLRYRPPVLMVPYLVKKDFPIPESNYVAKKGTMIVPSTWLSLHDPEAYENPDNFVPERWTTGNAEEQGKNWLVFGTGPHYCLGQTYAILNLMLLLHKMSASYDWKHKVTNKSEEIKVFATIFPMDDLQLSFSRRAGHT